MSVNRKLYPPKTIWQAMRLERLEQVGYKCEVCGLPDATEFHNPQKPHPFYPQGTPYRQYLQFAHKSQYQTWNRQADGVMLCPPCHGKFDVQFRRKRSVRYPSSVGQVEIWVWYQGERCLASVSRYFDDLLEVIASFQEGWRFEVCAEMLMRVAGVGLYRKEADGVTVLQEEGYVSRLGCFCTRSCPAWLANLGGVLVGRSVGCNGDEMVFTRVKKVSTGGVNATNSQAYV